MPANAGIAVIAGMRLNTAATHGYWIIRFRG